MSGRGWRYIIAAGGLATVVITTGLLYATWRYASPQEPRIARYEAPQGPERGYQPDAAGCDPKRLNALPAEQAPAERDRCAQAAVDHRAQQAELSQSTRANDLAEGDLRLAYEQARIAFAQTLATVLAFVAAVLAAVFAGIAVYHSKRSADADNEALIETRKAAEDARTEAAEQATRSDAQVLATRKMAAAAQRSANAAHEGLKDSREGAGEQSERFGKQLAIATKAANAAAASARAIEKNARIELTAYLGLVEVHISDMALGKQTLVKALLRNTGRTPAKNVRTVYHLGIYPAGQPALAFLPAPPSQSTSIITAGEAKTLTIKLTKPISDEHFEALRSGNSRVYFWGRSTFEDVFGDNWELIFQHMSQGAPELTTTTMTVCEAGNDYGRQNS